METATTPSREIVNEMVFERDFQAQVLRRRMTDGSHTYAIYIEQDGESVELSMDCLESANTLLVALAVHSL